MFLLRLGLIPVQVDIYPTVRLFVVWYLPLAHAFSYCALSKVQSTRRLLNRDPFLFRFLPPVWYRFPLPSRPCYTPRRPRAGA